MQSDTRSELRMLRELARHFLDGELCHFCGLPLLPDAAASGFGHRDHPPIDAEITVHHADGNHENNAKENRKPCHSSCHKSYHLKLRRQQEKAERKADVERYCKEMIIQPHGNNDMLVLGALLAFDYWLFRGYIREFILPLGHKERKHDEE
jgi:hypothetical protein